MFSEAIMIAVFAEIFCSCKDQVSRFWGVPSVFHISGRYSVNGALLSDLGFKLTGLVLKFCWLFANAKI